MVVHQARLVRFARALCAMGYCCSDWLKLLVGSAAQRLCIPPPDVNRPSFIDPANIQIALLDRHSQDSPIVAPPTGPTAVQSAIDGPELDVAEEESSTIKRPVLTATA
jgi:hypothetical protein